MAMINIDLTETEASKPREVLPPGWYVAAIDASEVKPTKKAQEAQAYPSEDNAIHKNDCLLQLTLKVLEGDAKGRQLWHRLNVRNANEIAQKIAEEELAAICDAIKHARKVTDSVTLHGKPMRVKVDVETSEGQPARNVIKGFEGLGGSLAAPAASVGGAAAAPAWNRK
jgi:Protein of unknown function (DUF669)